MTASHHPLANRILALIPIHGLEPRLQDEVLAQGEIIEFKRKKVVFEEGARDPYTFYLLDGELDLRTGNDSGHQVRAGDDAAQRALAQLQPRRYTARTVTTCSVFRIERAVLDHIVADEQVVDGSTTVQVTTIEEEDGEGGDWMSRLLSSELFTRLPPDNIQRFFAELEPVAVEAGDEIVEQGSPGDYLYIIAEGRCAVNRRPPGAGQPLKLAELEAGDVFGEEALISNAPRNASVVALETGFLMRLGKREFEELVSKPTLKPVPWSEACSLVEQGAKWLDVRFAEEHKTNGIEGSLNIPLNLLRLQAGKLDRSVLYVVYCDSGARASTGAFLLARQGFDPRYLAGGLLHSPLGQGMAQSKPDAVTAFVPSPAADQNFEFEVTTGPTAEDEPAASAPIAAVDTSRFAAELEEARTKTAEERRRREEEVAAVREQLAAIKQERDEQAARGDTAVEAARELKSRYEQLRRAAQAERAKREELEKTVADTSAEAERRFAMEKARLEGELEKAGKKLDELQQERDATDEHLESERARFEARVAELEVQSEDGARAREEAEAERSALEVAYEDRVGSLQSDLEAETARAAKAVEQLAALEGELQVLRKHREEARRDSEQASIDREQIEAESLERLAGEEQRLKAERVALEARLAEVEAARQAAEAAGQAAEESLAKERASLEEARAAATKRVEELNAREMDLEDRGAGLAAAVASREAALTRAELELSEEKAGWQAKVEQAVADERAKLDAERERLESERAKLASEREEEEAALRAERESLDAETTELRARAETLDGRDAELEARRTEIDAARAAQEEVLANEQAAVHRDVDVLVAEERARLEQAYAEERRQIRQAAREFAEVRVAEVRAESELRLAEQAALLDDQSNRLETRTVRLREALQGQHPPAPSEPVPDLSLDMEPDLTIIEDEDEPEPEPEPGAEQADSGSEDDPSKWLAIPGEEPSEDEGEEEGEVEGAEPGGRGRVLAADQLADIRRRMQEKLAAHKARAD